MAIYTRPEIETLCRRLEAQASSIVSKDQSNLAADMKAAALLLRLLLAIAEIERIETAVGAH
jgi:hypothetical protein